MNGFAASGWASSAEASASRCRAPGWGSARSPSCSRC